MILVNYNSPASFRVLYANFYRAYKISCIAQNFCSPLYLFFDLMIIWISFSLTYFITLLLEFSIEKIIIFFARSFFRNQIGFVTLFHKYPYYFWNNFAMKAQMQNGKASLFSVFRVNFSKSESIHKGTKYLDNIAQIKFSRFYRFKTSHFISSLEV